jgi:N-acetylneuraminic acid mutarotase
MHQVYISHAEEDRQAAARVCAMLEEDGIGCWLATRDATPGESETAQALGTIQNSDLVLLVFSGSANSSPRVLTDLQEAAARKRPLLPLRVDEAIPNASLQRYIDMAIPLSPVIAPKTDSEPEPEQPISKKRPPKVRRRTLLISLAAGLVVVAVAFGLGFGLTRHETVWTRLSPSGKLPQPREVQAMIYDPITKRVIMFGGSTEERLVNDTWAYDPVADAWAQRKLYGGAEPSPRGLSGVAYDPGTQRLIMFSGGEEPGFSSETWTYDPVADTWTTSPTSAPSRYPTPRIGHVLAYDPNTGKLIMFGGGTRGFDSRTLKIGDLLNDTWAYDPVANTWTNLRPSGSVPEPRYMYAMAYDPSIRKVVLFGGMSATGRFGDTWAYDPVANTWTKLEPAGKPPAPRAFASLVYDNASRLLILFGGGVSLGTLFNDVWAYDGVKNTWTQLKPAGESPSARGGQSMAYDPSTRRLIMFGGLDEAGTSLNDTWALTP